jgi:sugar phosphate isomerase/epimerase
MKIVCASVCYRGYTEDEIEGMLQDAADAGYQYVEFHGSAVGDPERLKGFPVSLIKQRLDSLGLRCAGLYPPGFGGKDDADAAMHADAIARACEIAAELGADYVDTTGAEGRSPDNRPGLDRIVLCLERVISLTGGMDIKLAMENHYGNVLEQISDYAYIFAAVQHPRVGICVDTGHFHTAGVEVVEVIHQFKDRLYGVHLKDHIGKQSVGIGRGEIDLPSEIRTLREIGYQRALTVELEHPDKENTHFYVREALAYLSGLLERKF